ncbi:MAG: hypothetical protein GY839_11370 [candidate division Zixibacteria bacterium]|nr:hypothetical protein [candidate division Zixibacteria bacterium]
MNRESQGNTIQLILDGQNFFHELRNQLEAVRLSPVADNTYVRLAFWEAEHNLNLQSPTAGPTLETALKWVANVGHRVEIILWKPSALSRRFDPTLSVPVYNTNLATMNTLHGYNNNLIQVYFEEYKGWIAGISTHQKIAIFSIGGVFRVLIGGINLARFYWDSDTHPCAAPYAPHAGMDGNSCHDAAVLIRGPATLDVEREWLRRWNKQYYLTPRNQIKGNIANNPISANGATVNVVTTNSESWAGREADIQALLIRKISRATNYIYLENYAFCDPGLVWAICKRLREHRTLKVIVMIPHRHFELHPFNYLARIAYAKLALTNCITFSSNGNQIFRRDCQTYKISENLNIWSTSESILSTVRNRWLESDSVSFRRRIDRNTTTVRLSDITSFDGGIRFYTPARRIGGALHWIYIHSKLALIDDETAFIGTSNFSYRSMVYDGEIGICISNGQTVRNIRNTLFAHWGLNVADVRTNWDREVRRFQVGVGNGLGVVNLNITDLDRYPFPVAAGGAIRNDDTNRQYKYLNYTYY